MLKLPAFEKPKGIVKPQLPHLEYTILNKSLHDGSGVGQEKKRPSKLHGAAQRSRPVDNLLYFLFEFQPTHTCEKQS
jgi:hypothetical protein